MLDAVTLTATGLLASFMLSLFFLRRNRHNKNNDMSLTQLFVSTLDQLKSSALIISISSGKIEFANSFFLTQLGYSRNALIGKDTSILDLCDSHSFKGQLQAALSQKEDVVYFDTLMRDKDGNARPYEVFLQTMSRVAGGPFFVAIMQDIGEKKRVEKLQNQLIATVSHELRTPLTSIKGSLGLLDKDDLALLPEKTKFLIEMARKNSDRLMFLINDILDLERFRHKDVKLNCKLNDLPTLIKEAVVSIAPFARQHQIDILFDEPAAPVAVNVEPERVLQVINNLLSNAIKYSGKGSVVHINVQLLGEKVRVNVVDEGEGIPESMHELIFQPFARSSDGEKRINGTGLGLPISVAIIEAHNGTLSFDSEVGVGSRFYFELPLLSVNIAKQDLPVESEAVETD